MECKYVIVNVSELDNIDFSSILTTSKDTTRKNDADGKVATQAILQWSTDEPMPQTLIDANPLYIDGNNEFTLMGIKTIIQPDINWMGNPEI